jgi:ubiquinone/menaquinone biosynthesis C-methylase UbiE
MYSGLLGRLFAYVEAKHPRSLQGIREAMEADPSRGPALAEKFLGWLVAAHGEGAIERATDAYVRFSTDVNLHQARYNAAGHYENKSFSEVYASHYSDKELMTDYLLGVYLTNTLWAHHMEISFFFHDRFLRRLKSDASLVEIAPGHGGWGVWALDTLPQASLTGFDISSASISIAGSIAAAAGVGERATYSERDALDLDRLEPEIADACICSFLVEHLEEPSRLFAVIHKLLKKSGFAYITGALTAAQVDHIYEFRYESELVKLCEDNGLRVLETFSASPKRNLPRAQFLPRSMALVAQRRTHDLW